MTAKNIKTVKGHFFGNYTTTAVVPRSYIVVGVSIVVHIFGLPIRHQQTLTAVKRHESWILKMSQRTVCSAILFFVQVTGNVVTSVVEKYL